MNNIIAVTMGDPAGIGPEIIIKSPERSRACWCPGGGGGLCAHAATYYGDEYHAAGRVTRHSKGVRRPFCSRRD